MGTDHTVLLLKLHDGSLHGPQSLEGCPTCLSPHHLLPFSSGTHMIGDALDFLSLHHSKLTFIFGSLLLLFLLVAHPAPQFSHGQFLSAIPISESVTVFVAFPAQHVSPPQSLFSHHSVLLSSVAYCLTPACLWDVSSTIGTRVPSIVLSA